MLLLLFAPPPTTPPPTIVYVYQNIFIRTFATPFAA